MLARAIENVHGDKENTSIRIRNICAPISREILPLHINLYDTDI